MNIKDSGERREFESGAVRDIQEGKGRCDLLPLGVIGGYLKSDVLQHIEFYVTTGDYNWLYAALNAFSRERIGWDKHTMILEVAKHYEEGCNKYGERNWEKGIPLHCFIDSAVRHYLKGLRGDTDEPHDRAFVWNILGAIWTHQNKPKLIDLPFARPKSTLSQAEDAPRGSVCVDNKTVTAEEIRTGAIKFDMVP